MEEESSPPATPTAESVPTGLLVWGVKDEFRRYVAQLSDGVCDVSSDVELPGHGQFGFPLVDRKIAGSVRMQFAGQVIFRGHGDLLFVPIIDPLLEYGNGEWLLSCRASNASEERFDLAAGRQRVDDWGFGQLRIPVQMLAAGGPLFGGYYQAGEPMSDLVVLQSNVAMGAE